MSGSMLLLKLLHSKELNKNIGATDNKYHSTKKVKKLAHIAKACRVCRKEASIPIYGNSSTRIKIRVLKSFCGIKLSLDDIYPEYLCQSCNTLLEGAILLRKTALRTNKQCRIPNSGFGDTRDYDGNDDSMYTSSQGSYDPPKLKLNIHYCNPCDKSFNSFKEYEQHRHSEEHENMRHTCPICQKSYKAVYYKKHLRFHKQAYVCDICGKKVCNQGYYYRHRLTHFYQLPYKCSLCPYKGRFSESLKMHMRSHTGERPYQCDVCPSKFISKSNLNKHVLTHKKERDFKCEICSRGFYTKRELEMHDKVEHRGIKDHVCSICGKEFGYRKRLMAHLLKVHKRAKLKGGRRPLYLQVESMETQGYEIPVET